MWRTLMDLLVDPFLWVITRVVDRWGWGGLYIAIATFVAAGLGWLWWRL